MLTRLAITLSLGAAACLALAAGVSMPEGLRAARTIAAADDPVRLSELALDGHFDATIAAHEIEAALGGGDVELARSFLDLAAERGVKVAPALVAKTEAAERDGAMASSKALSFARGFVTGKPEDVASAAGMLTGDLFVFGDIRDVVREGWHGLRGEEVDPLVLGLAGTGIAVTAGLYVSAGLAAPVRAGVSVAKAARRGGHMGAPLMRLLKVEKREGLLQFVSDLGKVQQRTGLRGTLDALKIAEHPKDAARLAALAAAKGGKTRAIVKLLGRGAIFLTTSMVTLASWIFWALLNLLALCAAAKRTVEGMTLRHCEWQRVRCLRLAASAQAA
ncbi:MAG: hypothetical protein E6G97_11150 [Alphaproteobacteria bacterium]|nr:MAG: hypothetical protein E6G97_11150 [Alphaproteobacteria bacterium]